MNPTTPPTDERARPARSSVQRSTSRAWISRRGALWTLAGGFLTLVLLAPVRRLLRPRPAPVPAEIVPLADAELQTLVSLCYVLLPSSVAANREAVDPAVRRLVIAHTSDHDSLAECRDSAAWLNDKSRAAHQRAFAELDRNQQHRLIDELLRPLTTRSFVPHPYYYVTADGGRTRRLWYAVAKPLIVAFYRSALGWQVVGYARRPGECSNLTDYQFPPGAVS